MSYNINTQSFKIYNSDGQGSKNLRTEAHVELKEANKAFNECLSNVFLPQWMGGAKVNVTEVCQESYDRMQAADEAVYGERPMNIKTLSLPEARL